MIGNLFKYVSNLPTKLIKKDSLSNEIDDIYSNIRLNLRPSIDDLVRIVSKRDIELSKIEFFNGTNLQKEYRTASRLLKAINALVDGVLANRDALDSYTKNIPNNVSTKGITTNQALVLNVVDNLRFFIEFTGDILIYIVEYVTRVEDSVFAAKVTREKRNLLYDYHNIITNYTTFKEVLVDLGDMVITDTNVVESVLSDTQVNVVGRTDQLTKGFIGNPIYHIRIWNADREIRNIKTLESKKEYTELLLAELEIKQANQYDPELDSAIEKTKDLINEYEIRIEKLSK